MFGSYGDEMRGRTNKGRRQAVPYASVSCTLFKEHLKRSKVRFKQRVNIFVKHRSWADTRG